MPYCGRAGTHTAALTSVTCRSATWTPSSTNRRTASACHSDHVIHVLVTSWPRGTGHLPTWLKEDCERRVLRTFQHETVNIRIKWTMWKMSRSRIVFSTRSDVQPQLITKNDAVAVCLVKVSNDDGDSAIVSTAATVRKR